MIKLSLKKTEQKNKTNKKSKRKQKTVWYNPIFSSSVKSNTGREFKKLVKNISKKNPLSKIFNKHNMRINYSYTAN